MKILYHHRISSKDGQVVHIEEMVRALRDLGHEVVVVGPRAMERANFGDDAGHASHLKNIVPASLYELLELGYSFVAFWRLLRIYRRVRPDVLYERYNLFLMAGIWLKRITGIPMLLEVNAPLVDERSRFGGLANKRLAAWAEQTAWRSADYVLPVTNALAEFVRRVVPNSKRIVVIQNGVGAEFLRDTVGPSSVRQRFGLEGRVILGFTGFVREWHGLERVIDLIAKSDRRLNLHLLIVGDGPILGNLRRQAENLGISDRVTFAGLVPRDEIVEYVSVFDVAMQPMVVPYASPLKLIEYMALRRAIVAPSMPNVREVLAESEAMLFDPDDDAAFRIAVERLSRDPDLRKRLGKAARKALERQDLTWVHNAQRIVGLFEGLLTDCEPYFREGSSTGTPDRRVVNQAKITNRRRLKS
jgi:glycosyltransferase involved in cell wall biosynthesis